MLQASKKTLAPCGHLLRASGNGLISGTTLKESSAANRTDARYVR